MLQEAEGRLQLDLTQVLREARDQLQRDLIQLEKGLQEMFQDQGHQVQEPDLLEVALERDHLAVRQDQDQVLQEVAVLDQVVDLVAHQDLALHQEVADQEEVALVEDHVVDRDLLFL